MLRAIPLLIALASLELFACADSNAQERERAAKAHRAQAEAALAKGDFARAGAAAEMAAAYDPLDPKLRDLVVRTRLTALALAPESVQIDRPVDIDYQAETLAARDPVNAPVYKTARGYLALARNDEKAAETFFKEAGAAKADWAPPLLGLGLLRARQGNRDEALASLEKAQKADPKSFTANAALGKLLVEKGELERGTQVLEQTLAIRDAAAVRVDLAAAMMAQKKVAEAGEQLKRAVALEPSNGEAHRQLGEWMFATGQTEQAQVELATASKLGAEPLATFGMGRLLQSKGEFGQAARHFEAVWNTDPRLTIAAYQAGLSHEQAGNKAGAIALYGRYVQAAGQDAAERERVLDAMRRMERLAAAPETPPKGAAPKGAPPKPKPAQ